MSHSAFAFGLGVGTQNSKGEWLEVFFPQPILDPPEQLADVLAGSDSNATLSQQQLRELEQSLSAAGENQQAGDIPLRIRSQGLLLEFAQHLIGDHLCRGDTFVNQSAQSHSVDLLLQICSKSPGWRENTARSNFRRRIVHTLPVITERIR